MLGIGTSILKTLYPGNPDSENYARNRKTMSTPVAGLTLPQTAHTIKEAARVIPQQAACPVGISLAVGHLTLDQAAEVRILHPQPLP